jgi:hypothetical protein
VTSSNRASSASAPCNVLSASDDWIAARPSLLCPSNDPHEYIVLVSYTAHLVVPSYRLHSRTCGHIHAFPLLGLHEPAFHTFSIPHIPSFEPVRNRILILLNMQSKMIRPLLALEFVPTFPPRASLADSSHHRSTNASTPMLSSGDIPLSHSKLILMLSSDTFSWVPSAFWPSTRHGCSPPPPIRMSMLCFPCDVLYVVLFCKFYLHLCLS